MKNTNLKIKKKVRISQIRKLKQEVKSVVHDGLLDIEKYIVDDIMIMLKKKGIIYYEKNKKKN